MPAFATLILAGALWSGGASPPADLPDSLITRALPAEHSSYSSSPRNMVASAHPLASAAGVAILLAGGNSADAAVAVQAALAVVEPESSGPGGGCLILYHEAAGDSLYAIDGREELPAAGHPRMFLDESGAVLPEVISGGLPVGVPGTIAAMSKLHARFGTLPLAQVLAPAIALAEGGFPVSPDLARAVKSEARRLLRFAPSRRLFFRSDGSACAEGDTLRNPQLAAFFRLWAADPGGNFFYKGEVAKAMVETVGRAPFRPGFLSLADLAAYKAVYREPIFGSYRGRRLAVFPPPTSGGITLLEILGLMATRPRPTGDIAEDGELLNFLDSYARASRVAFADRDRYLGDWDWHPEIPMWSLADADFVDARSQDAFHRENELATPAPAGSLQGFDTTHFAVVDQWGNMISVTSTIEYTCGSAMLVPGYGFLLNNELTDFNLIPSDPPAPNDIEPARRPRRSALDNDPGEGGKRPRSSMCPLIAYDEMGAANLALGSPGGPTIIGTVAQVLLLMMDYDLSLPEAIAHPRLYSRNLPLEIETFRWNRELVADSLRGRGWEIAPLESFPLLRGDVQAVSALTRPSEGQGRRGASDPRGDGRPSGS